MDQPIFQYAISYHGIFVMVLVLFALVLFANSKIPLSTSSLAVLVILIVFFELFPFENQGELLTTKDFFAGFGHEALITVISLMIIGQGIVRTGALEIVGHYLAKQWSVSPSLTFLQTLLLAAVFSAFINNTPIVILLLPILVSVSLHTKTQASTILMPMGFATLIGGMSTTIGTSTNLLVVSVAADLGLKHFSMFDFVLPAVIAGTAGILYLWLIAPKLLRRNETRNANITARLFLAQLKIQTDKVADGKTLAEVIKQTNGRMEVLQILRGKEGISLIPLPDVVLHADDRLMVRDTPENLKSFEQLLGATLYNDEQIVDDSHVFSEPDQQMAEVVIIPGSTLDGRTLNNVRFTNRYQLMILALHRVNIWQKRTEVSHPGDMILQPGDVILVQGPLEKILNIKMSRNLMVLDARADLPRSNKSHLSLLILAAIITPAALGLMPISISALAGVLMMLLTKCLSWKDASNAVSTSVVLIVVASLAMGVALVETGAANFIAQYYVHITQGFSAPIVISGLILLLMLLTNIVSNNAAAVIGTPISISIAAQLNMPAEPFVLAVLFGANMSFVTPMAYQTNLLVMNAGNYQFKDFVRVGLPLALLMWLILSFLLPWLYGI